jgi:sec-independent protein translocase protein TatA
MVWQHWLIAAISIALPLFKSMVRLQEEPMGEFSIYHWLIVVAILLLFFGGRRIPELMKGLGEGIRSFKEGMAGKPNANTPPAQLPGRGESKNDSPTQHS